MNTEQNKYFHVSVTGRRNGCRDGLVTEKKAMTHDYDVTDNDFYHLADELAALRKAYVEQSKETPLCGSRENDEAILRRLDNAMIAIDGVIQIFERG